MFDNATKYGYGVIGQVIANSTANCGGVLGTSSSTVAGQTFGVKGVISGTSDGAAAGVIGDGSVSSGYGVIAAGDTSTPTRSSLRIVPQDTLPATAQVGDVCIHSSGGSDKFYIYLEGSWRMVYDPTP